MRLKLPILALFVAMVASPSMAQTSFYTDRALQQVNVLTSPTPLTAAIPYGSVRVCGLPLTQQSPCLPLATITDINGNPVSNVIGPLFGQLTTDATGRFTFGCTLGLNYQVQVAASASNTPAVNYPITCPGVGSNPSFTNLTSSGTATLSGGAVVNTGIIFMGGTYPCTLAGINSAIQALPAAPVGGTIYLCSGQMSGTSTVVIDRPVHMIGQKGGYNGRGTLLVGNVVGVPILSMGPSSAASSSILEDFGIDNIGTANVCLDVDSTAGLIDVHFKDLFVCDFPHVVPTVAAMRFGATNSGTAMLDIYLDHVVAEGNGVGFQFLRGNKFGINFLRAAGNTTNDVQIGGTTAGQLVTAWNCSGCDIESTPSTTETNVLVNNVQGLQFDGLTYGEQNGSYWLDCPSTALECSNVNINGLRMIPAGGTFQYVIDVNLNIATFTVKDVYGTQLPAASFWVRNQNSRRITVIGTSSDNANTGCVSSVTAGTTCLDSYSSSTHNPSVIAGQQAGSLGIGISPTAANGNTLELNQPGTNDTTIRIDRGTTPNHIFGNEGQAGDNCTGSAQDDLCFRLLTHNFLISTNANQAFKVSTAGAVSALTAGGSYGFTNPFAVFTAPTIAAAGCGGGAAAIVVSNGTAAFKINVGTTPGSACTFTMPTATTGWNCFATDITTNSTSVFLQKQTGAESQTSVTITNFSDVAVATAFVASDILKVACSAD